MQGSHLCSDVHFNCTIQELKTSALDIVVVDNAYFNCTIQELKRTFVGEVLKFSDISIAPYRN